MKPDRISLSCEHKKAVNKKRRIVVQNDAMDFPRKAGVTSGKISDAVKLVFGYSDSPDNQIDTMIWDIELNGMAFENKKWTGQTIDWVEKWQDSGIDFVKVFIDECNDRNIESMWNHRINCVDFTLDGKLNMEYIVPPKKKLSGLVKCWWWQGFWDLSCEDTQNFKVDLLREIAMKYDIDGIQLDFLRNTPFLPLGRQYEKRSGVTDFVFKVRKMLLEVEDIKNKPMLLSARVPKKLNFCLKDGLDVEKWIKYDLVDFLSLGSRSVKVDIPAFKEIIKDKNIKLYPCFDDHHATDGYRYANIEYLRGIFDSWFKQGADGVGVFNWSNANKQAYEDLGYEYPEGSKSQEIAYREIGLQKTLELKDKTFVEERKGGYPWGQGVGNKNADCVLPYIHNESETPVDFLVYCSDKVSGQKDVSSLLRVILHNGRKEDEHLLSLNEKPLKLKRIDSEYKDPQIFSPKPQPASGGGGKYKIDPNQKLLLLEFEVPVDYVKQGYNKISYKLKRSKKAYKFFQRVKIEKIELSIKYD